MAMRSALGGRGWAILAASWLLTACLGDQGGGVVQTGTGGDGQGCKMKTEQLGLEDSTKSGYSVAEMWQGVPGIHRAAFHYRPVQEPWLALSPAAEEVTTLELEFPTLPREIRNTWCTEEDSAWGDAEELVFVVEVRLSLENGVFLGTTEAEFRAYGEGISGDLIFDWQQDQGTLRARVTPSALTSDGTDEGAVATRAGADHLLLDFFLTDDDFAGRLYVAGTGYYPFQGDDQPIEFASELGRFPAGDPCQELPQYTHAVASEIEAAKPLYAEARGAIAELPPLSLEPEGDEPRPLTPLAELGLACTRGGGTLQTSLALTFEEGSTDHSLSVEADYFTDYLALEWSQVFSVDEFERTFGFLPKDRGESGHLLFNGSVVVDGEELEGAFYLFEANLEPCPDKAVVTVEPDGSEGVEGCAGLAGRALEEGKITRALNE